MNIIEGIIENLVSELAAETGRSYNVPAIVSALEDIAEDSGMTVSSMSATDVEYVIRAFEIR